MYPTLDEPEIYETHTQQGYVLPAAFPNYVTPQPYGVPYITTSTRYPIRTHKWSTGLCRCLDDPGNCLVTCFCPCITFGQIAEILNKENSSCPFHGAIYGTLVAFTGFACLYSCFYRSKLRAQYELTEAPCIDCLVHFCCETCALCQEYRELKNRGFDMSIGWEANMERQRNGVTVSTPVHSQTMTR